MAEKLGQFVDRLFAPLGRFIVEFEGVCEAMRAASAHIFKTAGLQRPELAEITLAGLTAGPLLDVCVSLTSEAFSLDDRQISRLKEIKRRAQGLIEKRNRAIHSRWLLIDFADIEHGAPDGVLMSSRRRAHGLERQTASLSRQELQTLGAEAKELAILINEFYSSLGALTEASRPTRRKTRAADA